ncbi:MAG: hypothetical protein V3U90_06240 [Dehalococcoidia bacterium]
MKKKLAFLGIVALVALMAFPATALAQPPTSTSFSATAVVGLTGTKATVPTPAGVITTRENLSGSVVATDWSDLAGATLSTDHNSRSALLGFTGVVGSSGSITGQLRGNFTFTSPAGDRISGRFDASIGGSWMLIDFTGTGQPIVLATVTNSGSWQAGSGSGIYSGVKASGSYSGSFAGILGAPGLFGGTATFSGTHR